MSTASSVRSATSVRDLHIEALLHTEGVVIVRLSGSLDTGTCRQLRACLKRFMGQNVLVDLEALTSIDEAGASELVKSCNRIRSRGGSFSVTGCQANSQLVLKTYRVFGYLRAPLDNAVLALPISGDAS